MKRIASVLLIAVFAIPALAQPSSYENRSANWWRALEYQIIQSLDSEHADIKVQQLQNIITFNTFYRDRLDVSAAVPMITQIHRASKDAHVRALAVAALQSIDTVESRSYVNKKVHQDEIEDSRDAMMSVLSSFTSGKPLASL